MFEPELITAKYNTTHLNGYLCTAVTNIEVLVSVGLATPEGIAVDWIAERIYWVESSLDQIEVARFDGTMRLTIISGNMESPRAIAVDPRER